MRVHLYVDFFSIHTIVLHDPRLAESLDAKLWIWRADCKVMCGFSTAQESAPPTAALFQGLLYLLCTWSCIRCFPFRTALWGKVEYLYVWMRK